MDKRYQATRPENYGQKTCDKCGCVLDGPRCEACKAEKVKK